MSFERDPATIRVIDELKRLYRLKIMPLEQMYRFDVFHSPCLTDAEFDAKPQVMLLGQYSVGKTTFIRYLLGEDFPGQRIGPEPTTDRFTAIFDGPDKRIIPGNALAVSKDMPFRGLEKFGVAFLNRFEGAQIPNPVLRNLTLIDTPGVLSGEKQRIARGYDFCQVCSWFANHADLIFLLFDAHKLDISDEFRNAIEALKGNDDKIRCVLNKADQVDRQRLMRVYGALMWSLGKVITSPEVLRVYLGSFWDQPLQYADNAELFALEEADLMRDLKDLPRNSAVRKINELVKRVRLSKVHAYIISTLKDSMPMLMGHSKKQQQLLEELPMVFRNVLKKYNLSVGDFPEINDFKSKLKEFDFSKFHSLKPKLIEDADHVLSVDFPRLMDALPRSHVEATLLNSSSESTSSIPVASVVSNPFPPSPPKATATSTAPDLNPFGEEEDVADSNPFNEPEWPLEQYISIFSDQFNSIQSNNLVSGVAFKKIITPLGLPVAQLRKVWELSDIDKDGSLNLKEFVIGMYLVESINQGQSLPDTLDPSWIP